MNTETMIASPAQRLTASQIWSDLEEWNRAFAMSDIDFYAVWGLCKAILDTDNRDEATYARWTDELNKVWSQVKAKYSA